MFILIFHILGCCLINFEIILYLENDSLSISKRRIFKNVNTIYKRGELERIEMKYSENEGIHIFSFYLFLKSGKNIKFFELYENTQNIEQKGINLMLNIINTYINNNSK